MCIYRREIISIIPLRIRKEDILNTEKEIEYSRHVCIRVEGANNYIPIYNG